MTTTPTMADLLDSALADLLADAHQARTTTDPDQVWRSYRAAEALAHQAIGLLRQHEDAASRREAIPAGPVAATTEFRPSAGTATAPAASTGTGTTLDPATPPEADMLPSDSIALDVQNVTDNVINLTSFDDYDEADLRDACKQLRQAVDQLADLAREALILLSGHETDALARQDIPEPADDDAELIAATAEELERLQEIAQTRDYAATTAATDQIADRIGPEATELLIRQIIAAGAATLLEILDAESEDLGTCDDAEAALG